MLKHIKFTVLCLVLMSVFYAVTAPAKVQQNHNFLLTETEAVQRLEKLALHKTLKQNFYGRMNIVRNILKSVVCPVQGDVHCRYKSDFM
ncbi:MAG: hypothetical protein U9N77_10770, partial [Thermodesulfobacteriota bacterium]|nr:hypothetical protein [Thermodesulfobacteriota bacterium]